MIIKLKELSENDREKIAEALDDALSEQEEFYNTLSDILISFYEKKKGKSLTEDEQEEVEDEGVNELDKEIFEGIRKKVLKLEE